MIFEFSKDSLGTVWLRETFKIEAENYQEAIEKTIAHNIEEGDFKSEILFDTWQNVYTDFPCHFKMTEELLYKDVAFWDNSKS